MTSTPVFIGLDVAKSTLDVALRPSGEQWSVPNDEAGVAALVDRLRPLHPALLVCEATGGFERAAIARLATAGLPVVVANPRQIRDFARATGQLAKTDQLDAAILALFAERVRPTPRPLPDEAAQLLDALLTRRRQLLEMLVAEKNRLGFAPRPLHQGIQQHIRWLERQLDDVTKTLADQIEQSPVWRAKDDLLQSVPGVGPSSARCCWRSSRNSARSAISSSPPWRASPRWPATAARFGASAWCGVAGPGSAPRSTWRRSVAGAGIRSCESSTSG